MDCLVAITVKLNAEALIPPSLYEALCSINNEINENDIFAESVDSFTPFSNDENDAESENEIFYVESDSDNLNFNSDYSKMKDEQNNCDSLKKVRAELKLNKGNFLLVEELIYHRDKILNEPVMQLVLPRCRIDKVMKLAHELLYGREARGPLAILKSSWAGEIHLPTNISQSAADYLQEMKIKMEKAAESASLTAAQKQKSYGDYFNKRSSIKNFSIGEQVVLLIPDSSNKIYARWTGPGEIIQHHPPHSYKVKLPDGTVRHVHVNKIRKYHPRALAVGVIFEDDHEFGEIHPTPNLSRSTSERVLHETDLNHLKETEREQVLAILLRHRTLFTSDVKIAKMPPFTGKFVSDSKGLRLLRILRSNKINAYCPAALKVTQNTGGKCVVSYQNVHIGHQNDIGHLFLTVGERKIIASKIAVKIPLDNILDEIRNSISDAGLERVHLLTKKKIYIILRNLLICLPIL
ncbi:integrase catalytic domain-containing protein [Trichonephila clavata]|uniref:Integrase catalytic domain-containing protein n=1 Tax=Trichonephila clavata TaxID=2740835 RepID=A0A8X6KMA4_TRICU|nr:integrase catalytic domain-containing protein [Trichonephila clavata]